LLHERQFGDVEIMPEKLERYVADVKAKNGSVDNAHAICNASIEESMNKQIIEASLKRSCKCQKKKS